MERAMSETNRRRSLQEENNRTKGIIPTTVIKSVRKLLEIAKPAGTEKVRTDNEMTREEKLTLIAQLEKDMKKAAKMMEYEYAAVLRDRIIKLSEK